MKRDRWEIEGRLALGDRPDRLLGGGGLACQHGLIALEVAGLDQPQVRRHDVADVQDADVTGTTSVTSTSVAAPSRSTVARRRIWECRAADSLLRPVLVEEAERDAEREDREDDCRIGALADRGRDDGGHEEQQQQEIVWNCLTSTLQGRAAVGSEARWVQPNAEPAGRLFRGQPVCARSSRAKTSAGGSAAASAVSRLGTLPLPAGWCRAAYGSLAHTVTWISELVRYDRRTERSPRAPGRWGKNRSYSAHAFDELFPRPQAILSK